MAASRRRVLERLTARQVNLALELLLITSILTGVASWMVALDQARVLTFLHAMSGFSLVLLAPLKVRGSVTAGFRRRKPTRWISTGFGILIVATIVVGVAHSTGLWYGVGYWSALWTHLLLGFVALPLAIWHIWTRPVRPRPVDFGRRALVTTGGVTAVAAAAVVTQEVVLDISGADGADRAGTGSHELASFDPDSMPVVSWIDDRTPRQDLSEWTVRIDGVDVFPADVAVDATKLDAELDCTGGWRSTQSWDVVPLEAVLPDRSSRSVRVTSVTGYSRLFARSASEDVYLCTGYAGRPLRRGHGAPMRIVAPGRRGPWWVKWISSIELSDRPSWLQLPFPPT